MQNLTIQKSECETAAKISVLCQVITQIITPLNETDFEAGVDVDTAP